MKKEELKELKKVANSLKSQFNVGKEGITETFVKSVDDYLEAHSIVKIKVLSAVDKVQVADIAKSLSSRVQAEIVEKKGFTFVLYRERRD